MAPLFNPKFNYQPLERITSDDGTRVYETPTGQALPSVTTILGATGDKSGLLEWRQRVGEKEANRVTKEAAGLGTLLHTHMENYIRGEERPSGNNMVRAMAREMADAIIQCGLVDVDEVWGLEEHLYYPGLYAGTADVIGVYKGEPSIMDFKTARKMKKEDWITDYFLQGSAYSHAHNELHGTDIKSVVIFMVDREKNYQTFHINGSKFDYYSDLWLRRLEDYYKA
jgi:genome maintenance exonuclease 1